MLMIARDKRIPDTRKKIDERGDGVGRGSLKIWRWEKS